MAFVRTRDVWLLPVSAAAILAVGIYPGRTSLLLAGIILVGSTMLISRYYSRKRAALHILLAIAIIFLLRLSP